MQINISCVPPAVPDIHASLWAVGATQHRHGSSW